MFYEHLLIVPNSGFIYDFDIHTHHSLPWTACLISLSLPPFFFQKPFISSSLDPLLTTPVDTKFVDFFINLDIIAAIYEIESFLPLE